MANVTLATLRDYWKNVSDWVKGTDAVSSPKIQISGRKAHISEIIADTTTVLGAGLSEVITITPTAGYKARVKFLFISIDPVIGAAAGSSEIVVYQGLEWSHVIAEFSLNYNTPFNYRNSLEAGVMVRPKGGNSELLQTLENIEFDANIPLSIKFTNNTGVDNTQKRFYRVVIEEEAVV